MAKRDPYEVLEVHRKATEAEIKKAYRRLALKYHPDRNPDDKAAETRFKLITEAYEVLGNPERRARYDHFGFSDEGGFGSYGAQDFDFRSRVDDLFGEIFGDIFGHRRPRGPRPARGSDLRYDLTLDFDDAVFGCTREIEIPARRSCAACGGSGARRGTSPSACPECGGHGRVRFQQGFFHVERDCRRCKGEGRISLDPCPDCGGQGTSTTKNVLSVRIPPGVETGTRLRLSGEGEAGANGGPAGDLYVVLTVREHPLFTRHGDDIVCEVPISFPQAALGADIDVPTLDGIARVRVSPGTQHGAILTLRGKGAPKRPSGRRGDQRIVVKLEVPSRVSPRQADLLREFESLQEVEPQSATGQFWDRVRKLFG